MKILTYSKTYFYHIQLLLQIIVPLQAPSVSNRKKSWICTSLTWSTYVWYKAIAIRRLYTWSHVYLGWAWTSHCLGVFYVPSELYYPQLYQSCTNSRTSLQKLQEKQSRESSRLPLMHILLQVTKGLMRTFDVRSGDSCLTDAVVNQKSNWGCTCGCTIYPEEVQPCCGN